MILTLNAGSSSLKYAWFETPGLRRAGGGTVERIARGEHAARLDEVFAALAGARRSRLPALALSTPA